MGGYTGALDTPLPDPAIWPKPSGNSDDQLIMATKLKMDEDRVDAVILLIMRLDGPDGHNDGYEVITEFIMAIQAGHGEEWVERYVARKDMQYAK